MTRLLAFEAKCPYCQGRLPKVPTREHTCPYCKRVFYVQSDSDGTLYVVTEDELGKKFQEKAPFQSQPTGNQQVVNRCSACHTQLNHGMVFCPKCGEKITSPIGQAVSPAIPPQNAPPIAPSTFSSTDLNNPTQSSYEAKYQTSQNPFAPKKKRNPLLIGCVVILAILVIIVIIGVASNMPQSQTTNTVNPTQSVVTTSSAISFEQLKAQSLVVSYDDLFRNIEQYKGKRVYYTGQVDQVLEEGNNDYQLRVYVTSSAYSMWTNDVLVHYSGTRLLEKDIIEFVSTVVGPRTYQTVLGAQRTIPELTALQARLYGLPTTTVSTTPSQSQPSTTTSLQPQLIATFSGTDDKNTASFTTTKSTWWVEYSYKLLDSSSQSMYCSFYVYPTSGSALYVASVTGVEKPTSDVTYIYNKVGSFYFKLSAYNTNWTLKVYE